jgi:nucleotide-binding universal stress UspA family protein
MSASSVSAAPHRGRIVVGVDGSPISKLALRWAVDQARLTSATVDAVIAWQYPEAMTGNAWVARLVEEPGFDVLAERELAEAISEVAGSDPDVTISPVVVEGWPAEVLLNAAEGADLLVVGSRGRGSVRSTVLGSVALHTVTHARCPVVVVHPRLDSGSAPPRVVVGIDGSDGSRQALASAVAEAGRLGAEVTAIAAYTLRSYWSGAYQAVVPPVDRLREAVRSDAEAMVAAVGGGTPVRVLPVEGPAGDTLVRAAEGADLLVVGGRGRGAVRGMLLGSVALHCVVHAPCPVMVVPVGRAGAAAG